MSGANGPTNWDAYNVEALYAMVADEGSCQSWNAPLGWSSMASTIDAHRKRLEKAREALEAAWPSKHNPGAEIFVELIDDLIDSMKTAAHRSAEISKATEAVMDHLVSVRTKLEPLRQRYQDKSTDWKLASWDHEEDKINSQARAIMVDAEVVLQGHATKIIPPKPYAVPSVDQLGRKRPDTDDDSRSDGRGGAGPVVSGIPPRETFTAPHNPPPPMAGRDPMGAGVRLATHAPPAPVQPGVLPIGGSPSLPVQSAPVVPVGPGVGVPPYSNGVIGAPGGVGGPPRMGPVGAVPMRTVMPPGGVIGGGPGGGMMPGGVAGGPSARLTPGGSGLPGVLGAGGRSGAGAGTGAGPGMGSGAGMMGQGRGGRSERSDESVDRDPDNPWAVAQGVAPVIEPDLRPVRHDPGPGVIGYDR